MIADFWLAHMGNGECTGTLADAKPLGPLPAEKDSSHTLGTVPFVTALSQTYLLLHSVTRCCILVVWRKRRHAKFTL